MIKCDRKRPRAHKIVMILGNFAIAVQKHVSNDHITIASSSTSAPALVLYVITSNKNLSFAWVSSYLIPLQSLTILLCLPEPTLDADHESSYLV